MRTAAKTSFEPVALLGSPVYVQYQGLGNRLPLFGNSVNALTYFLSRILELGQVQLLLIFAVALLGMYSFFSYLVDHEQAVSVGLAGLLACLAMPLIAVSMRHTVLNDWSENAIAFWALVGLFANLTALLDCYRRQTQLPSYVIPTFVLSLGFLTFGHPVTGLVVLPIALLSVLALLTRMTAFLSRMQLLLLLTATAVFTLAECAVIFDLLVEHSQQTQYSELLRQSRYQQTGLWERIAKFVVLQTGITQNGGLGFVGFSAFIFAITPKPKISRKRFFAIAILNVVVVLDYLWTRLPLVSFIFSGESYALSEWLLVINLLVLGSLFVNTHSNRIRSNSRFDSHTFATMVALVPMVVFLFTIGYVSLDSPIAKWEKGGGDASTSIKTSTNTRHPPLVYTNETINRGIGDVPSNSLEPYEAQAAGIATLNTYSRVRSSQTLVQPWSLFENGIRENYCIDRWVARFLQLDAIVGERFCDKGWDTTDPIEINIQKVWIHDVKPQIGSGNEPCPLLEQNCRDAWRSTATFTESELDDDEYFARCKQSCVAQLRAKNGYSNLLTPLNFDSGLQVKLSNNMRLRTSNFHGLLLVEIPLTSSNYSSAEITFHADLRVYLRSAANLLVVATIMASVAVLIQSGRRQFRLSISNIDS